jgi:tyrosinase
VGASAVTQQFTAAKVMFSDVRINQTGAGGGYFYNLYLNLPKAGATAQNLQFGNLGPFRIHVGMHHDSSPKGVKFEFDITELLLALRGTDLSLPTFSFVRVSGPNAPVGEVITIGDCRLVLT